MELAATTLALPEERLLIRELTHRVINEFTSLANMMSLAAARTANIEARAALEGVMCRLDGYIDVHRALQMPQPCDLVDASAHLRELCRSMISSKLEQKGIHLVLVERLLVLSPEQCWLLGLIVYELVNNAVRHAFDEAGGEIRVEVRRAGGFVECRVSDNGRPPIIASRGRGLRIIEDLTSRLHGHLDQQFTSGGSASLVIFPSTASQPADQ